MKNRKISKEILEINSFFNLQVFPTGNKGIASEEQAGDMFIRDLLKLGLNMVIITISPTGKKGIASEDLAGNTLETCHKNCKQF